MVKYLIYLDFLLYLPVLVRAAVFWLGASGWQADSYFLPRGARPQ